MGNNFWVNNFWLSIMWYIYYRLLFLAPVHDNTIAFTSMCQCYCTTIIFSFQLGKHCDLYSMLHFCKKKKSKKCPYSNIINKLFYYVITIQLSGNIQSSVNNKIMDNQYLLAWSVGFMYLPLLVVLIDRRPMALVL